MSFTKDKLIAELRKIKDLGFVQTHRAHDTGIGKTLEDLLGITENNLRLPDMGDFELKAKRIESLSMLTLATKSPLPRGINKVLFERYKYEDTEGRLNLHTTVFGSRINPQGFKVSVRNDKLILENKENIEVYWPISVIYDALHSKSRNVLLVLAETVGAKKSQHERFYYKEAFLLSELNTNKIEIAIKEDWLKIDIRIGSYKSGDKLGMYHDHGTAFRIKKVDYLHLYNGLEQIL